jgi:hypothetical protein
MTEFEALLAKYTQSDLITIVKAYERWKHQRKQYQREYMRRYRKRKAKAKEQEEAGNE